MRNQEEKTMIAWVVPGSLGVNYSMFTGKQCNTSPQSHAQMFNDTEKSLNICWFSCCFISVLCFSARTTDRNHHASHVTRANGPATFQKGSESLLISEHCRPRCCSLDWLETQLKFLFFSQTFQLETPNQTLVPSDQGCFCWGFSEDLKAITHKYWFAECSIIL